jgi:hypothetical protein
VFPTHGFLMLLLGIWFSLPETCAVDCIIRFTA